MFTSHLEKWREGYAADVHSHQTHCTIARPFSTAPAPARGLRSPTAPLVSSKLARQAPRKAPAPASPELEKR
jgi:hypothetical protein